MKTSKDEAELKAIASDALEFKAVAVDSKRIGQNIKLFFGFALAFFVGAGGWAFYGEKILTFVNNKKVEIPVIKADLSPIKRPPEEPGGITVPDQDKTVYGIIHGSAGGTLKNKKVERLLPDPEAPIPKNFGSEKMQEILETKISPKFPSVREKPKRVGEIPRIEEVVEAKKPDPPPLAPKIDNKGLDTKSNSSNLSESAKFVIIHKILTVSEKSQTY